jgi:hypothetical protein
MVGKREAIQTYLEEVSVRKEVSFALIDFQD